VGSGNIGEGETGLRRAGNKGIGFLDRFAMLGRGGPKKVFKKSDPHRLFVNRAGGDIQLKRGAFNGKCVTFLPRVDTFGNQNLSQKKRTVST